jgi:hypothetical protein
MKIALQLSGRLRFTENSIGSLIAAIIEPLQPDIFCSFWLTSNPATVDTYKQILKPKLMEIEDHHMVKNYLDQLFPFDVYKNLPAMSYKFYRVNQLRKSWETTQNTCYDLIIQARSDNVFFEKLDQSRCCQAIEQNAILCTNQVYNALIDNYTSQPRMVDNFYLGPKNLIDRANDSFWQLRSQAQEWTNAGMLHHVRIPEIIQTKLWQNADIPIASLSGCGHNNSFYYDIDRSETQWQ